MENHTNAYWILKEMGIEVLREHIYKRIPGEEFDSHDFIHSFVGHFKKQFDEMMEIHKNDGTMGDIMYLISNRIGLYLSKNREALGIEKTGMSELTVNLNLTFTRTSRWRKTGY